MVKRTPIPELSLRRPTRPSDVIFQDTSTPPPPAPPPAANVKITTYIPPAMLADLDDYRTAMLRERSVSLDRSRVFRELWRVAGDSRELLERLLAPEEAP